jgi:hypothetical protein
MAEIKKYLDTTALGTLVDQIKAEDAKVLAAAQKYTDDAGKLYDATGSAATAKQEAIADADAKFAVVNENIAKKADTTALEAEVTRATGKEAEIVASVEAVDAKADKNAEDIAAINNGETGILAQAKKYADDEDAKVEELVTGVAEDVEEVRTYVGTFTASEGVDTVVKYIDAKTANIASDETVSALADRVTQAEKDIDAIEADYLKAADKTAIEGKITAEETRATEAEAGLASRIKAVEDDYLVEADKTALSNAIALKADQTALDAEKERAEGVEEGLQNQINLIMNNPDTKDVIDSIAEFTAYVEEHGTIADGMRTDINKNRDDIAAMDTAYKAADTAIKGRLDALEAINHEAYVAADTALKNELNGEIAKKADSSALTSAVEALEQADAGQVERIAALEAKFTGEGSVADIVADAKQEAIDTAAQDATSKANKALEDAKAYADAEDAKIESRVDALEAIDHEHSNKALLDTYTQTEANLADAVAKKHEHDNKTVLDGITADKVSAWDASEQNAKDYADGLDSAMTAKVDAIDARVTANANAVATKAEQDDLDAAVVRIAANETAIAANTSAINSFTPITSDEVTALFA